MAKRRDLAIEKAKNMQAGAIDSTCHEVKDYSVVLGGQSNRLDKHGRVCRVVSLLRCHCRISGQLEPIDKEIEIVAIPGSGVLGELELAVADGESIPCLDRAGLCPEPG